MTETRRATYIYGAGDVGVIEVPEPRIDKPTDVVAERGEEGIAAVRDLTGGGSPIVLEAVGILLPGGVISRVGVPQYEEVRSASGRCSN